MLYVLVLMFLSASAHEKYLALNPNGAKIGGGLGHKDSNGGGSRNTYGTAFGGGGSNDVYTPGLCIADSDGDGQSNGFELGDECVSPARLPIPLVSSHSFSLTPSTHTLIIKKPQKNPEVLVE